MNIGIDVGGTFTDFVFLGDDDGSVRVKKVPTDPADLPGTVLRGLEEVDLGAATTIVHGTTVAINAVLQETGAKTAILVTSGFRDQIEIGDTLRYTGGLFDHKWTRTRPYPVPHERRFEVLERTSATGEVEVAPDEAALAEIADELERLEVEAVAICLINSYVNSANENQVARYLESRLPDLHLTISSNNPEFREYPRFITAVFNASISPMINDYVSQLGGALNKAGYPGEVLYMTSSGGVITETAVVADPLRLLLGGVAGGVTASAFMAEQISAPNVATFDMGGTSSDVGFIKDYRTHVAPSRVLIAFPIALPDLEVNTVGAGGGSIAWIDESGVIKVGPQSAGASPGPACYGAGGTELTVTDANLVLGRIGDRSLLDGGLVLDRDLATAAAERLGAASGINDLNELCAGVLEICITNMYGAIREVSVERGENPEHMALLAFGGAGALHAIPIAERLSMPRVVVPKDAGNFSAFGMLTSDRRYDYVRSYMRPLPQAEVDEVRGHLDSMASQGREQLESEGFGTDAINIAYKIGMRYQGQIFEEELIVDSSDFSIEDLGVWFGDLYEQRYDFRREPEASELVNLRVVATGHTPKPELRQEATNGTGGGGIDGALKETRQVYFAGGTVECPVYDRKKLAVGDTVNQPAVIEEYDSTTVLFPGWALEVDPYKNLVLTRSAEN
jgi:N-methylhydantoinase A